MRLNIVLPGESLLWTCALQHQLFYSILNAKVVTIASSGASDDLVPVESAADLSEHMVQATAEEIDQATF